MTDIWPLRWLSKKRMAVSICSGSSSTHLPRSFKSGVFMATRRSKSSRLSVSSPRAKDQS
ncbi:hypothetical protein D3C72_2370350 [compost metagenome]